jgi:predicted regulator of Ras-like GTPase activity (Roadblock/LC7/MglB family)
MSRFEKMVSEIEEIITEVFNSFPAVVRVTIATNDGKNVYSNSRKNNGQNINFTDSELAAAATSLLFIASNMFERLLNQEVNYTITKGEKFVLLCMITKNITGAVIFDRKLVELAGLTEHKNKMYDFFLRISAIVETSDVIKEDLFVQIRRAIPNSLSIAIINKDGLPIKVQSTMEEPKISAFIYALYQLTNILLKTAEYTIIAGVYGSIIIIRIDDERILGIAVPESDDAKLGKYIAKLEEIIRNISKS